MWLDHVVAQRAPRRVYWNVNYFGVIRAIAMARAVVGHRERVASSPGHSQLLMLHSKDKILAKKEGSFTCVFGYVI